MKFAITKDVEASAAHVFAVMTDMERWHEWTPTVTRVEALTADALPLKIGSRIRIVQPKVPPAEWVVRSLEPDRGFQIQSRSPGAMVTADHWIEPLGDGTRSRVTLSVTFDGWLGRIIGRLMKRLNERYVTQEADGLKRRSEESARSAGIPPQA
ncbi:MAG TPA: SRPBCC family protein [Longimicrobiales bacterium]